MITELKALVLKLRKDRSPIAASMQFHMSEIQNIGKNDGNRETSENEAVQYAKKATQKLKENEYANPDEIAALESLLPKMASREDVQAFLDTIDDKSNKGVVMKALKENFGVLVDMKMAAGMF